MFKASHSTSHSTFFFGQLEKPAEHINADSDAWYTDTPEHMDQEAYADDQHAIDDPDTVRAMLEDYRAGLGIDRRHDDDVRLAERRCAVRRSTRGHHMAEEAPTALAAALLVFLDESH